jgi:hypothetical protein
MQTYAYDTLHYAVVPAMLLSINLYMLYTVQEILSCHKSEAAFSNKSDSSTTESTSYVTSATRAVWCATVQSVLQALDGTKV